MQLSYPLMETEDWRVYVSLPEQRVDFPSMLQLLIYHVMQHVAEPDGFHDTAVPES